MGTVHAVHRYFDSQIKFGRFADTLRTLPNGDMMVDLREFDVIVPDTVITTPQESLVVEQS
jgi:hypothetical protein